MINDYGLFYEETVNYLIRDAEYYGINKTQLDTYFIQNPATFLPDYIMDDSVQTIFYLMVFIPLSRPQIGNVIKFPRNLEAYSTLLKGFDPMKVKKELSIADIYSGICKIIKKDPEPIPNRSIPYRYAMTVYGCAEFLQCISDHKDFIEKYGDDISKTIREIMSIKGYGIAFTCDFLKEFDERFDLIKPDEQVCRFLMDIGEIDNRKITDSVKVEAISKMQAIREKIVESTGMPLTLFKLDKCVFLACSKTGYYKHGSLYRPVSGRRELFVKYLIETRAIDELSRTKEPENRI